MTETDHLLVILMEECSELAKRCSKALRFGADEQRDLPLNNIEYINYEFNDVLGVAEMLGDHGIKLERNERLISNKKEKVQKYLEYSRERGRLGD